jgi:hypothetical protein
VIVVAKYRKKPIIVEAERITSPITVRTLEGKMYGYPGDWLITGVIGEKYVCRDEVFRRTYDPVEDPADH